MAFSLSPCVSPFSFCNKDTFSGGDQVVQRWMIEQTGAISNMTYALGSWSSSVVKAEYLDIIWVIILGQVGRDCQWNQYSNMSLNLS